MFSLLAAPAAATAAAAALAVIHMVLAQLAVGGGHKLLQLILKGGGLGRLAGSGEPHGPGTAASGPALLDPGGAALRLGGRVLGLFDGEVDAARFIHADDLDLDLLPLLKVVLHVIDVCIRDLRNMYQPGLSLR